MREISITANDAGRRLDRFLRKYLKDATLGDIYKIIRKDIKVDGRRRRESYILNEGEILTLYISDESLAEFTGYAPGSSAADSAGKLNASGKPNFKIVYEDAQILIADKPYGLLTHGDAHEKKDHLANRVKDYLIASGAYNLRMEKVFTPAPVNRLDRNTSGLVLFGKTSEAMRELNRMIREGRIRKFYLAMACGIIEEEELRLSGSLVKDESANKVSVQKVESDRDSHGRSRSSDPYGVKKIETIARPLEYASFGRGYSCTLCEVELITGRTHQIRAHLAAAGHPLLGDSKYCIAEFAALNRYCKETTGLSTQFLHAYRLEFCETDSSEALSHLSGRSFKSPLPDRLSRIFWTLYT